jgi:peptide deformylase
MTVRTVIKYPNPNLKLVSEPVTVFDDELKELVNDMFETMYEDKGIGLAAPQIDVHKQIVVIDVSEDKSEQKVIINPKFILEEGETGIEEGCLSVPLDYRAYVKRYEHVIIECQNEKGETYQIDANDLLAICIQHELDHLKGILFIDYLSSLKRNLLLEKIKKANKREKRNG